MKISMEMVKNIVLAKISQAETFIGTGNGDVKLEYVVNLVLGELNKLPFPLYIKVAFVVFRFAVKSDLRKNIQEIFDEAKLQQRAC